MSGKREAKLCPFSFPQVGNQETQISNQKQLITSCVYRNLFSKICIFSNETFFSTIFCDNHKKSAKSSHT